MFDSNFTIVLTAAIVLLVIFLRAYLLNSDRMKDMDAIQRRKTILKLFSLRTCTGIIIALLVVFILAAIAYCYIFSVDASIIICMILALSIAPADAIILYDANRDIIAAKEGIKMMPTFRYGMIIVVTFMVEVSSYFFVLMVYFSLLPFILLVAVPLVSEWLYKMNLNKVFHGEDDQTEQVKVIKPNEFLLDVAACRFVGIPAVYGLLVIGAAMSV